MNQIRFNLLSESLMYDNVVVLQYKIKYPQIVKSNFYVGQRNFNLFYQKKAFDLQNYIKKNLYKDAVELYKYNKENNYPIMIYEVDFISDVTKNEDNIVSLYSDEYIYSGGAHGNTIRDSQTWDLRKGALLELKDFYPNNPYYIVEILKNINKQIAERIKKEGEGVFFDNYCQLVLDTFKLENFYLYRDYIVIYFQQYDIAPYSTGIPTFYINKAK